MTVLERSALIDEMLSAAKTIAVVGISSRNERASFRVWGQVTPPQYLVEPWNLAAEVDCSW